MPAQSYGHIYLGVDYSIVPHELPAIALADSRNIVPNETGLPTGRGGSVKLNSTSLASRITSFHEFRSGSTRIQLCSYGTKIAEYSTGTGDFIDRNTGLTSNKMVQWVNFAGKAICVNEGNNVPQYYQNATTYGNLAGSPPAGNSIAEWSNRIWFNGDSTNVALLTGCALNDPTNYSGGGLATSSVSQTIGDSKDGITGGIGFFDIYLIGKLNNLYKVTGDPTTDATTLRIEPLYSKSTDNIGFTSPWALTQVGNDLIFLDGFDIKRLSGIQEYGDVETTSIIPHVKEYLAEICDKNYLKYTQFFHYKKENQIWVTMPTSATEYFVFVLDYTFKEATGKYAFYPMYNLSIACFGGVENGQLIDIYYGDTTGYVHQLDVGNDDNGVAIERYFTTVFSGSDLENRISGMQEYRKQFGNSETFIKPEQATLNMIPYYAVDLVDSAQVRTSANYTAMASETVSNWAGTGVKRKRVGLIGINGYTLAVKWRHNTVAQNFTFYPSVLHYQWKTKNLII